MNNLVTLLAYGSGGDEGDVIETIGGVLGALVLIGLIIVIGLYRARTSNQQAKAIIERHMIDQAMADDARARFLHQQEQERHRAWYAAQAATEFYCEGCSTNKSGLEMVWTIDGQFRCRSCAPEVG